MILIVFPPQVIYILIAYFLTEIKYLEFFFYSIF